MTYLYFAVLALAGFAVAGHFNQPLLGVASWVVVFLAWRYWVKRRGDA